MKIATITAVVIAILALGVSLTTKHETEQRLMPFQQHLYAYCVAHSKTCSIKD